MKCACDISDTDVTISPNPLTITRKVMIRIISAFFSMKDHKCVGF